MVSTTQTPSMPILQVEHLSMKFGGLIAINDLSFDVNRGEITALIGPNGAGKTTVFNCITGFYKPTEGMLTLRRSTGEEYLLERMADFVITKQAKVARTFQNIRLFSGLTVLENLLVAQHNPLMLSSGYTFLGLLGFPTYKRAAKEAIEKARHWLEKIDLIGRADDPAGDLPYGAQRRLEIARAMCTEPELLCLDEPAAGLNPRESAELNKLLLDIRTETGTSVLLIEHDMSVVMEISDHIVVLEYGTKIADGSPHSIKQDPKVIAAYLGVDDEEVKEVITEVEKIEEAAQEGRLDELQAQGELTAAPPMETKDTPPARPAATKAEVAPKKSTKAAAKPAPSKAGTATGIAGALTAPRGGKGDDLERIKGIGPINAAKLHEHGIFHFDQIAAWKKADIKLAETYLEFDGRIEREDWVGQAKRFARELAKASGPVPAKGRAGGKTGGKPAGGRK